MKGTIFKIEYKGEYKNDFGIFHNHLIKIADDNGEEVSGIYSSKSKEQKYFKEGVVADYVIEERQNKKGKWFKIKPAIENKFGNTNFARKIKAEQSRYSGFAMSYAKDLVVAGKLEFSDMLLASKKIFEYMVELDKSQQDGNN